VAAADRAGDEPRIGGEILVVADVDDQRLGHGSDQPGELFDIDAVGSGHGASFRKTGRDASAFRLMG
jgi:hypothetical protein